MVGLSHDNFSLSFCSFCNCSNSTIHFTIRHQTSFWLKENRDSKRGVRLTQITDERWWCYSWFVRYGWKVRRGAVILSKALAFLSSDNYKIIKSVRAEERITGHWSLITDSQMHLSKDRAAAKGRGGRRRRNGGGLVGELMLCFPTRPPLKLLPKPVSTPSTPNSDQPRSQLSPSPLFRIVGKRRKAKSLLNLKVGVMSSTSEPTSPKVSCVGQIKASSASASRMGEEEKRPSWFEALGLKNEIVHFFHAIRGLRLKSVGCFGKFRGSAVDDYTTDEDEEEETTVGSLDDSSIPPPNALLLMRCRSAPANGLLRREERPEEKEEEEECLKLSSEVVKETWVVGTADPLMIRCRSLKR